MCYSGLLISYILLALANHNQYLLFAFILQWCSGFGVQLNSLQVTMLYPAHSRLLIGLSGTATTISTILPLLWHYLIVSTSLTFSNMMVIWAILTFISLVICIFIGPWHNLKHFPEGETVRKLISKDISTKSANLDREGSTGRVSDFNSILFFTRFTKVCQINDVHHSIFDCHHCSVYM